MSLLTHLELALCYQASAATAHIFNSSFNLCLRQKHAVWSGLATLGPQASACTDRTFKTAEIAP